MRYFLAFLLLFGTEVSFAATETCVGLDEAQCSLFSAAGCSVDYDSCYNYEDETSCLSADESCAWDEGCSGDSWYSGCSGEYEVGFFSCPDFSSVNEEFCVENGAGLDCEWVPSADCTLIDNESSCGALDGCSWLPYPCSEGSGDSVACTALGAFGCEWVEDVYCSSFLDEFSCSENYPNCEWIVDSCSGPGIPSECSGASALSSCYGTYGEDCVDSASGYTSVMASSTAALAATSLFPQLLVITLVGVMVLSIFVRSLRSIVS